jgi:hypothetical protein
LYYQNQVADESRQKLHKKSVIIYPHWISDCPYSGEELLVDWHVAIETERRHLIHEVGEKLAHL